jgi:ATP-dependent Clp protease ATP-binding subunit ClpA
MFERFTNRARHVVVLSQEEARRLQHNYIGTEHLLLGLIAESGGVASRALSRFGITLDDARGEVKSIIGIGKRKPSGHIPFTPRAKKVLELSLREALQLHHKYIGTEHILLGLLREGEGVAAQIIRQHCADLLEVRMAVLDLLSVAPAEEAKGRRWLRRRSPAGPDEAPEIGEQSELRTTPAADTSLSEAARLAGSQPVGSHHLLLAALADANSAAARALTEIGVELGNVREALRNAAVTGTSDEPPEEAGRRQMVVSVTDGKITVEATDPLIIKAGQAALAALGDDSGVIRGEQPAAASLSNVWQALYDGLTAIERRTADPDGPADEPGAEVA